MLVTKQPNQDIVNYHNFMLFDLENAKQLMLFLLYIPL